MILSASFVKRLDGLPFASYRFRMAPTPPEVNGPALRRLRQQLGIKPAELAGRLGVSTSHLRNIECGFRQGSPELRYKIARALGVDVTEILTDHGREELAVPA